MTCSRPPRLDSAPKKSLLGLPPAALAAELDAWADRAFRIDQVFAALHRQRVQELSEITVLSKAARRRLEESYCIARPVVRTVDGSSDGTAKYLFELADGATIEAVEIPDRRRRTLCLSSQAGCALGCRFCVTGYWGAGRDLGAEEIVGQVYAICDRRAMAGERDNLVFMGMGEPLLNLKALRASLEVLSVSYPWRRMTVSTAGVIPAIEEMMEWPERPNLALSLHAPDEERRSRLMPINRKYPLRDLLEVARRYPTTRHRPLLIEYTLIAGFNDSVADASALARLLAGLRVKVNLIPLNPDPVLGEAFAPPLAEDTRAFQRTLLRRGLRASVRRRRGDDVAAACGQLRAADREPRGFRPEPVELSR